MRWTLLFAHVYQNLSVCVFECRTTADALLLQMNVITGAVYTMVRRKNGKEMRVVWCGCGCVQRCDTAHQARVCHSGPLLI